MDFTLYIIEVRMCGKWHYCGQRRKARDVWDYIVRAATKGAVCRYHKSFVERRAA